MLPPRYGSRTIGEVLASALGAMGVGGWANTLELPSAESFVVLLVDGLGWNLLRRHAGDAPFLNGLCRNGLALNGVAASADRSRPASPRRPRRA